MVDAQWLKDRVNRQEGFALHNGITVTEVGEGYCACRVEMSEEKCNPHHFAHGGLLFAMCDTAAGTAATSLGRGVVTRSADIHFLRPGTGRVITAEGRVTDHGRTHAYGVAEARDESGKLVCAATFEMVFLEGQENV